ncbi:MATE family efflux transporter [Marinicrinis sediminis]|uniref:MATE family efflux transporter n=1 Tax=Marinicrinis sediminis TaxID=1652465 RepID=A0ABW5RBU9_9BACL
MKQLQDRRNITLFALTWPIFIEMFLHILMGNADTLMLSQYSDESVAAVGLANQILGTAIMMFGFIVTGTSVLVAQSLGANDRPQADKIASVSITMNIIFGLLISVALFVFGKQFLIALNVPANLMDEALIYLRITGGLSFIQALIMTISAIIRAHSFTRQAMYVTMGMNVLNIIGNYLLIFGPFGLPVLGVVGVAISTVVARAVGLIIMFILLYRVVGHPRALWHYIRMPIQHVKDVLRIGIPSAGEHLTYNVSQLLITYFITLIGAEAVTARIYTWNIMFVIMIFSASIGQGTQILVSYKVGEGQNELAYKTAMRSLRVGMLLALLIATTVYLNGERLIGLFTDNPGIIEVCVSLLLLTIILEPGRSFNLILISSLRAAGDVRFPVYMAILSMLGIAVTLSYVLGIHFGYGLAGIWIAFIADEWLRGLLMLWRWRSRSWERMRFIQPKKQTGSDESTASASG